MKKFTLGLPPRCESAIVTNLMPHQLKDHRMNLGSIPSPKILARAIRVLHNEGFDEEADAVSELHAAATNLSEQSGSDTVELRGMDFWDALDRLEIANGDRD